MMFPPMGLVASLAKLIPSGFATTCIDKVVRPEREKGQALWDQKNGRLETLRLGNPFDL